MGISVDATEYIDVDIVPVACGLEVVAWSGVVVAGNCVTVPEIVGISVAGNEVDELVSAAAASVLMDDACSENDVEGTSVSVSEKLVV